MGTVRLLRQKCFGGRAISRFSSRRQGETVETVEFPGVRFGTGLKSRGVNEMKLKARHPLKRGVNEMEMGTRRRHNSWRRHGPDREERPTEPQANVISSTFRRRR